MHVYAHVHAHRHTSTCVIITCTGMHAHEHDHEYYCQSRQPDLGLRAKPDLGLFQNYCVDCQTF